MIFKSAVDDVVSFLQVVTYVHWLLSTKAELNEDDAANTIVAIEAINTTRQRHVNNDLVLFSYDYLLKL